MSRTLPLPIRRVLAVLSFAPVLVADTARAQGGATAAAPCAGMELRLDDTTRIVAPARSDTAARDTTARAERASTPLAGRPAAIRLLASVSAREVRFAARPIIRIRLCGALDSARVVERRNLPTPVVAGTTYRDVYVSVEILGRLNADCLAARLGAPADSTAASVPCAALDVRARGDSAGGRR